jgi:hypothetical protein
MNNLDDFEKYLRDQLKGHAEPEPLMWNRLTDAIGRATPWYARSAFKYTFTAIGAMVFGAISSYIYLDQRVNQNAQTQTTTQTGTTAQSTLDKILKESDEPALQGTFATQNVNPITYPNANAFDPIVGDTSINFVQAFFPSKNLVEPYTAFPNSDQSQLGNPADKLKLMAAGKIKLQKQELINRSQVLPLAGRFELSLSTGNTWNKLPSFDYQLGPQGMQHAAYRQQQSPFISLQARVYKNWHLQAGIQMIQTTLEEHFYKTEVYSYDDKENYLFPYLYGFRQVSDEELHEGPWPYSPNPPGGGEVSKVKADYSSI